MMLFCLTHPLIITDNLMMYIIQIAGGTKTSPLPSTILMISWKVPTLSRWRSWMVQQVWKSAFQPLLKQFASISPHKIFCLPWIPLFVNPTNPLLTLLPLPSQGYEHENARSCEQHPADPHQNLEVDQGPLCQDGPQDDAQGGHGSSCPHLTM